MIKIASFSFLSGIGAFLMLPNTPDTYLFLSILAVSLLVLIYLPSYRAGLFFTVGFFYAWHAADGYQSSRLPEFASGQKIQLRGTVADVPKIEPHKVSFVLHIEQAFFDKNQLPIKKVKLNWYKSSYFARNSQKANPQKQAKIKNRNAQIDRLTVGQRLQVSAKLKSPHGRYNRFGFDYEKWLLQKRLDATGYVVDKLPYSIEKAQDTIFNKINKLKKNIKVDFLSKTKQFPLLNALLFGDRTHMNDHHWQVLRHTGTNHLLAISGLHLGLFALMVGLLLRRLCLWSNIVILEQNSLVLATFGASLAAVAYAGLVGFSVPTQRAMLMLAVLASLLLMHRPVRRFDALALVLMIVLINDPFFVLSTGFWLSFSAVFWILFAANRFDVHTHSSRFARLRHWVVSLAWLQLVLSIGMMPILASLGFGVSLVGFVANLIALPAVSLMVLPTLFLSVIFQFISKPIGDLFLTICDNTLDLLWNFLEKLSSLPYVLQILPEWNLLEVGILCLSIWLLLAPVRYPFKLVSLLVCAVLLFPAHKPPVPNTAKITVYDVGQGLSVGVQTHRHFLLFDTGRSGYFSPSVFASSVAPWLQAKGIARIDRLIVSHGDNDHAGGVPDVLNAFEVGDMLMSEAKKSKKLVTSKKLPTTLPCRLHRWHWDGVEFEILHPRMVDIDGTSNQLTGNNASCVLSVRASGKRMLLLSDIEKTAEHALVASGINLKADVMQVAHHGSQTSSTKALLDAINPKIAVISSGYKNRYRHPHPSVINRLKNKKIQIVNTSTSGAIEITLGRDIAVNLYRKRHGRFWHQRSRN